MTNMPSRILLLITCLLLPTLPGCGDSSAAPDRIASAEGGFDAGQQAFQNGDFAAAESHLTAAISAGVLQPDLLENALLLLARSRIAQGKLAEAEADLKQLEQGVTALDQYWLANAELSLKKNDAAAARKAVQESRKANPKVELPATLKNL
ncbi:MAG: hypothetical protein RLZZ436_3646 [Planctomycetota bacterium]|jgi:tetratricopeptide (TPR) repeat protein